MNKFRAKHVTARAHAGPSAAAVPPAAPAPDLRHTFRTAWVRFWFAPVDPIGLHAVRFFAGLLFLAWLLPFAGHADGLFGLGGFFDVQAYAGLSTLPENARPALGWSLLYMLPGPGAVTAFYWGSVLILALFTAGVLPRITAVLTWLIVASFTANPVTGYGGDALLQVLAFYLMVGYLLLGLRSADSSDPGRFLRALLGPVFLLAPTRGAPAAVRPSLAANLTLRLLQVHFAIIVVTSGLHKLQSGDWWSGSALWYPLYPAFETTMETAREHASHATFYLMVLSVATYLTLAWELTFPLFAWRPRWRLLLLGGSAIGWVASVFVWGLPLFGPAFFIGACCFVTPAEWRGALARLLRLPGLQALAHGLPASQAAERTEAAGVAAGRSL